jgi:transmembrane sensor
MKEKDITELLIKFEKEACTPEEIAALETWYIQYGIDSNFEPIPEQVQGATDRIWARLQMHTVPSRSFLWIKLAVAASILLALFAGLFFYFDHSADTTELARNDIAPGGSSAILTLSDGSKVSLSTVANGQIANQSGVMVSKEADGQLVYDYNGAKESTEPVYNTVETPKGGEYEVTLPDGSHVWLNAATKLKFPASFKNRKERKVEIDGEGYFEVAKNKELPFKVVSKGQEVEVTGTHFNVNSYVDEPATRTTLLEGRVQVNGQVLVPGQQSILNAGSLKVVKADVEAETAWKDGEFVFSGDDLQGVMRKIARWYDVEVIYPAKLNNAGHFDGEFPRKNKLSVILKALESTGNLKFKIEGRRVTLIR